MAQLVSMKQKSRDNDASIEVSENPFPWGLRLHLNDEVMDKLSQPSLRVGDDIFVLAKATVKSMNSHEDEGTDGEVKISVELQITDMALDMKSTDEKKAKKLFPTSEEE